MTSVYLVVEGGRTEPALYAGWLPHLLPGFSQLHRPEDAQTTRGFYIVAGFGYPSIINRINSALEDIKLFPGFGRLVISLDCEERTVSEVEAEIRSFIPSSDEFIPIDIVVANCAVESWLLGNRRFIKRNPNHEPLISWRRVFDVVTQDPELMPNFDESRHNTRAQFHKAYLKAAYREHGLSYSESRPGPACTKNWLEELITRAYSDSTPAHLQSFRGLLKVMNDHISRLPTGENQQLGQGLEPLETGYARIVAT